MCKKLDANDKDHHALLERMARGEVTLFLGSGFSLGAKSYYKDATTGERIFMPSVNALKELLARDILFTDPGTDSLKQICEDCRAENRPQYESIMSNVFSASSIVGFQEKYAQINWKKIFTTNVDNIIEKAYDDPDKLCCIYSDVPPYQPSGAICYYKLHGCAIKDPGNITFSTTDYVTNASKRNDYRFEQLTAALKTDNILFVGTSLSEEWDYDIRSEQADIYVVSNKAYFVLKDYDEKLTKRLKRRFINAVFIQETAESFIEYVCNYLQNRQQATCIPFQKWGFSEINRAKFYTENYLKPNLYQGAEPTWQDIFSNHDVIWDKTKKALCSIESPNCKPCQMIIGKAVSGKTTMLYRLGASLSAQTVVLEYIGNDFLEDLKALSRHNTAQKHLTILLDDANWIIGRIEAVLRIIHENNILLIITLREKEYLRRKHLFDAATLTQVNEVFTNSQLSKNDIGAYLDKLNEKSFLGKYGQMYLRSRDNTIDELIRELKKNKGDQLLGLSYLMSPDKGKIEERLEKISTEIAESENYNVKRFAVLLYYLDVIGETGVKLSLFLLLYPQKNNELRAFVSEIQDLLVANVSSASWEKTRFEKITIHARLPKILVSALRKFRERELTEIVEDILRRLDAAAHFECRKPFTYLNYVLYSLLRSQNIDELFRIKIRSVKRRYQSITALYENLHKNYNDYHIYWLHRGISEIKMKEFSKANIHLQQARASRNGYSFEIEHAFATLYYDQAIASTNCTLEERLSWVNKAQEIIRIQINNEENDAFTVHSFVVNNIKFYESIGQPIPESLWREMTKNYYLSRERFNLDESKIRRNMLKRLAMYYNKHKSEIISFSVTPEEFGYLSTSEEISKDDLDTLSLL